MGTESKPLMANPDGERHSDEEYIEAVQEHEPAGTSEVAEAIGVARQSADYRLRQLEDHGLLASKMVGNSLVWRPINQGSRNDASTWVYNPVTGTNERVDQLPEDGYKRRFLELLDHIESNDVYDLGSSPVLTFDKERWTMEEQEGTFVVVKREAETRLDELVLDEGGETDE